MMRTGNDVRLSTGAIVVFLFLATCSPLLAEAAGQPDSFSKEEIETAARFNRYLYTLFVCKQAAVLSFLGLVSWSRLASSYRRDVEKLCRGKKSLVFPFYAFFIVVMIWLVTLPFDAVRDIFVKGSFGLTHQTIGGWLADQVKSFFVADIWCVALAIFVYRTMRRFRRTWWAISAGAVGLGLMAWYSLSPYLIEPLFYRVTPVRSGALRGRIYPLLKRAGVPPTALYEADSGKKTKEVNAYASGLFLGRRIVLYDVLAEEAEPPEIEFVVAHEIAHLKMNHTMKGIALGTAGAAGILFLTSSLMRLTSGKRKKEASSRYGPDSLPVFFFWLQVVLFLVMPIECAISRRYERTADRYAVGLTKDPQRAAQLFQKIARKNLSDLNPPTLAKMWLYSHPPIRERVRDALRTEGGSQGSGL